MASPAIARAETSITQLRLNLCNVTKTKCLTLESPKAVGSDLKPMYFMKNAEIELKNPNESEFSSQITFAGQGVLDFENNQLVIRKTLGDGRLQERVFNLTTLNESVYYIK